MGGEGALREEEKKVKDEEEEQEAKIKGNRQCSSRRSDQGQEN